MTIKREDVDRHAIDLSDVTSGQRLAPVHHPEHYTATGNLMKPWQR